MKKLLIIAVLLGVSLLFAKEPLGSKQNPIKMYFVPSGEVGRIMLNADYIKNFLQERTGYSFKTAVPLSYAAVIEAMGTKQCDIAWLATFAYILAHQKYQVKLALTTIRYGLKSYRGQFIARADSPIKALEDIAGHSIAYTDPVSTSGYMYPSALLAQKKIKPSSHLFAGGHTQAVMAVYSGRTDVGCTYWSPVHNGEAQDARKMVLDTYPDVFEKTKIVGFTDWIPNDTVTYRQDLPKEIQTKVTAALLELAADPKGKEAIEQLYSINGFYKSKDSDYDVVRNTLKTLGINVQELVQ